MPGKEGQRENIDYYGGGSNGHSLTNGKSQENLEESLRSSSYSGFSPSSHSTSFSSYSGGSRDNYAPSPYFVNNAAQSNFDSYSSGSTNADSSFDAYNQGSDQVGSDFNQYTGSKQKNPSYARFSDNLPGASNAGSYPELGTESSSFRAEYSGDSLRSHTSHNAGFMDGADHALSREATNPFNGPNNDYSYGKHKDALYGVGGGSKFINDAYSLQPETRYVRGNHGNMARDYASSMFLSNSGNTPFSNVRGNAGAYGSGKITKYNKYLGDYTPSAGLNYLSKEQDVDYLFGNYGKGSGKLTLIKDGRPGGYGSQTYLGGPSYVSKIVGGYKSKPSYMNSYSSSSPVGYSSMSGLHNSFSNSYADGPLLRRYRSSSYVPGHVSTYPGYY